ncbi:MAG: ATP-binding protein [Candidatus Micrarchaeota archaeon]
MDFIKEALRQNAHWETGRVELFRVANFVERRVFTNLQASAKKKFVTVLRGLRRTGKSVLARELMKKTVESEKPQSAAWFEFDRAMNASADDLDALINFFESKNAKLVVLDEVPFVPSWQDVVKRFYDRTETKFVVTGSSALELDKRTAESLAGRIETILVKPFTLEERVKLKGTGAGRLAKYCGTAGDDAVFSEALAAECEEYLRCGGLPEISVEKNGAERNRYVNDSLLNPLFYKDLPAVFERANPDLLRKTIEILAGTVSSTFQLQSIAQVLGCTHPTAGTQVELLERALLVKRIYNYTPSLAKQKRTAKKIVFTDNGVLAAVKPDASIGALAENAVLNALEADYFWRDAEGREVDCLLPKEKIAVEVKYQEHVTSQDERNLRFLLERRKGWRGVVVTKNDDAREAKKAKTAKAKKTKNRGGAEYAEYAEYDGEASVSLVPLWKILVHGRNALR